MATELDFTKFDEVIKQFNDDPEYGIKIASIDDFRLISWQVSQDAYSALMDKLEGNEGAQKLLFAYSHLQYIVYEIDKVEMDGLDMARKLILEFLGAKTVTVKKKSSKGGKDV